MNILYDLHKKLEDAQYSSRLSHTERLAVEQLRDKLMAIALEKVSQMSPMEQEQLFSKTKRLNG